MTQSQPSNTSSADLLTRVKQITDEVLALVEYEKDEGRTFLEGPLVSAADSNNKALSSAKPVAQHDESASGAVLDPEARVAKLREIAARIARCKRCELARQRTHTVAGQGCVTPEIMFIGEGPGEEEDRQGLAFVGRAGQLLTRMIAAMGYTRDEVFIGNVVKCRPPGNRTPYPHEMEICLPYLEEQIAVLQPKVIIALGGTAVRGLLHIERGITKLRGNWLEYKGIPVMPTYHPAYLLRNEKAKPDVWKDLQEVLKFLGRKPPIPKKKA